MKRAVLILGAAVGAGVALGPGPAGAGTADDTVVTSHPLPGGGYVLEVTAAAGTANRLVLDAPEDIIPNCCFVRDTGAGISDESSECTQGSTTVVRCRPQGLRRIAINAGGMNDALGIKTSLCDWYDARDDDEPTIKAKTGGGNDQASVACRTTVNGAAGGDTLNGRGGNQRLLGGRGGDNITGGRGSSDHCDGQAGDDEGGEGCETIVSIP